jgi:hypothetical protein
MKRISIRQPIINAIDETDPSLSRFQNQMMKWAKHIEKEIGSKLGYKYKALKYTVTGSTIELPDDCYRVVMLLLGDYEDQCNSRYLSIDWAALNTDIREETDEYNSSWYWYPSNAVVVEPLLWEEIADELNLIYEYTGTDITLIYQVIETDEHGFWLINESHSDAITKFIKYKVSSKYNWKIFKSDKMLRQGHLVFSKDLERDYNVAIRHARAEDGQASSYETEQY